MTNIHDGVHTGLDILLKRKEVNENTALFLLSDGLSNRGGNLDDLKKMMKNMDAKLKKKEMPYKIHSFGYFTH